MEQTFNANSLPGLVAPQMPLVTKTVQYTNSTPQITTATVNAAMAVHDALSDYIIAPLGRVNHLQGLMNKISLQGNNIDLVEGSFHEADYVKIHDFLKEQYPGHDISVNITRRGKNFAAFYLYVQLKDVFKCFVFGSATNNFISYVLPNEDEKSQIFNDFFFAFLPPKEFTVSVYEGGTLNTCKVEEKDTKVFAEFYPFLSKTPDDLIKGFYENRARVMIFTGEAGTGKSSLMRYFLNHVQDKFVLLDDPSVYDDPAKMNDFLGTIRKMSKDERVTVFLEEADKIIQSKQDSHSGALERLLSLSSGVVEHNIKIVIASNLENVDKVYPALVRDGRSYAVEKFRKMTRDEAQVARKAFGLGEVEFEHDTVSLATALNTVDGKAAENSVRQNFGFLPAGAKHEAPETETEEVDA